MISFFGLFSSGKKKKKELEEKIEQLQQQEEKMQNDIADYQKLIENLRSRIRELETNHIQEMADLQACYKGQVEAIQEKLKQANSTIGAETRSKTLLEQTNNALSDLCSAISNDNVDEIKYVTQKLEWSNPLTRIAQHHITILQRKKELEQRLRLE